MEFPDNFFNFSQVYPPEVDENFLRADMPSIEEIIPGTVAEQVNFGPEDLRVLDATINLFLRTYPPNVIATHDVAKYFGGEQEEDPLNILAQAAIANEMATHLVQHNMPGEMAQKVADFAAKYLPAATPQSDDEGAYLRKEESKLPFTVQIGYGQMFALLKSKIPQTLKISGAFKVFRSVVDLNTGERYAQCVVNLDEAARKRYGDAPDRASKEHNFNSICQEIINELNTQGKFSDINVVNYTIYTAKDDRNKTLPQPHAQRQGDRKISLIIPYAEGTGYQMTSLVATPLEMKQQFLDLGQNLLKMHQAGMAHLDIKPPNILIFKKNQKMISRLSDFGMMTPITEKNRPGGTNLFIHPVYWIDRYSITLEQLDLWAFALSLFEILHPGVCIQIIEKHPIKNNSDKCSLINKLCDTVKAQADKNNEYKDVYDLIIGLFLGSHPDKEGINQYNVEEIKTIEAFVQKMEQPPENFRSAKKRKISSGDDD